MAGDASEKLLKARQYAYDVYVESDAQSSPALAVRWVGREWVKPGNPIHYVSRRYASVRCILEGNGVLRRGAEQWPLRAGMAVWGGCDIPIGIEAAEGNCLTAYVVLLMGSDVGELYQRYLGSSVGAAPVARAATIEQVMFEIVREAQHADEHMAENCTHLAHVLLNRLHSGLLHGPQGNGSARQTFRLCKEYIDRHFSTADGLATVAQACGVTVPHLCRLFDQFSRMSPHEYLTRLRLKTAERLLLTSSDSVQAVAASVGYDDWRLLCRNFKACYGDSPERYRKRVRTSSSSEARLRVRRKNG